MMTWRRDNDVSGLLSRPLDGSELFARCWGAQVYGTDLDGHLVVVERIVDIDVNALLKAVSARARGEAGEAGVPSDGLLGLGDGAVWNE
jgi:hypothetical protein